jgi:hypothetical protein
MAVESRNQLKTYFQTGDFPTQAQFENFLDSYIHKQDGVAMVDVAGLVAALNGKATTAALELVSPKVLAAGADSYQVPPGTMIFGFLVKNAATFGVGTAAGLDDIIPEQAIGANYPCGPLMLYFDTLTTIYFKGVVAGSTIIKIFKS